MDVAESYGPSTSRSNILANLCPIKINQTPSRSAVSVHHYHHPPPPSCSRLTTRWTSGRFSRPLHVYPYICTHVRLSVYYERAKAKWFTAGFSSPSFYLLQIYLRSSSSFPRWRPSRFLRVHRMSLSCRASSSRETNDLFLFHARFFASSIQRGRASQRDLFSFHAGMCRRHKSVNVSWD